MRRVLTLAILLMFCWQAITLAQKTPRPSGKISVAEILNKHFAATGRVDARRALQTVHVRGSFGLRTLQRSGDFDFYYRAPANDVFQLFMVSHGKTSVGHNEGAPFVKTDAGRTYGINGVTVSILEENWLALTESGFDQRYTRIELVGLASVEDKWAYALRFTPKVGDPQLRYYDCQNFLMVRMDLAQRIRLQKDSPESAYKVETHFSDYRDSGGIKLPRQITATTSEGDLVLDIVAVDTNLPVSDSIFRTK